jgi:hypothetical protein
MEWLQENWLLVASILFAAISEIISLNPKWKSNGIIQLIMSLFSKILTKKG